MLKCLLLAYIYMSYNFLSILHLLGVSYKRQVKDKIKQERLIRRFLFITLYMPPFTRGVTTY
jgi:hypothetical protein